MENPLQKALRKLREHQLILKDSNMATGMIELEIAEQIMEELEVDITNQIEIEAKLSNY